MERIFIQLVNMSLVAGWLILAVLLIRGLFNKLPKLFRCVLWGLVALRLICPWSIESDISIIPKAEIISDNATKVDILSDKKEIVNNSEDVIHNDSLENNVIVNGNYEVDNVDIGVKEDSSEKNSQSNIKESSLSISISALSKVWVVGIAAMAIYYAVSYVILKRKVSVSIRYEKNIYLCDNIPSAFILGLIKPKIYVPSHLSQIELPNVIKHERAHLSRHDNWWKPLGFCLLSLYWFNPLIWIAYIIFCKDIELACDEKVIKAMNVAEVKEYSNTLLECSISRKLIVAAPLAFGEVAVKSRIKSVLNYKKPAFWVMIVGGVISVAVAIGFMITPTDYDNNIDEDLDKFISETILEQYETSDAYRYYSCESHSVIGAKEKDGKTTVYMWVAYGEYYWLENDVSEETGYSGPVVLTAKKDNQGKYNLEEFWMPSDGRYYQKDIRDKFPSSLEDEVIYEHSYRKETNAECDSKAREYFKEMGYGEDRGLQYIGNDEAGLGPEYIYLDMKTGTCATGFYVASYANHGIFYLTDEELILTFGYTEACDTALVFKRQGDTIIFEEEITDHYDIFKYNGDDMFVLEGEYSGDEIPENVIEDTEEEIVIGYDPSQHVIYISPSMYQIDLNMETGTCTIGNLYLSSRDLEGTFELTADKIILRYKSMEIYNKEVVEVFRIEGDTLVYNKRFSQSNLIPEDSKEDNSLISTNLGVSDLGFTDGEIFKLVENYGE